ncbi:mesencephalic astrocyte-derived neurotrophic factor-like [Etheostoma cragini]|uniref:mesencephalic astrocyte-derived neurotrophic factor-like n=1 Tax=Etheostoma cragini TaxID=417921 RepID=UPI00155F2D77|nr:mesencephalic astrocyte-derived neurotrophic factor-like [Etheostoma cragini]
MLCLSGLSVALALSLVPGPAEALKDGECEVCVSFLGKFYESLKDNDVKFNRAAIEDAIVKSCKEAKGKDNRFVSGPHRSAGKLMLMSLLLGNKSPRGL